MELSAQLSTASRQLEAIIATYFNTLPAQVGPDLQLLAEQMDRWAEVAAQPASPHVCLAGPAPSARLRNIDRELAHRALDYTGLDPVLKMDLHNFARQLGDVAATVEGMEERLRPITARELTGNVVPIPRRFRAQPGGGTAA